MNARPIFYCLFLAVVIAFLGLGNTYFWEDESYNAFFARNFLETGELSGWDGRNLLAFRYCALLDRDFNSINPPLPSLLAAAGFHLFGVNAFGGRFLFVVCGLLSLPLVYWTTRRAAPGLPHAPAYAVLALAFSVSFLLYIRQCCYYAPAILFGMLLLFVYQEAVHRRSRLWALATVIPAVLLFYSHFLMAAAALGALAVCFLLFDARRIAPCQWLYFPMAGLLFLAGTLPFALEKQIWIRRDFTANPDWLHQKLQLIWWNLRELNTANWFPWMLAAAGAIYLVARFRKVEFSRGPARLLAFAAAYILVLSLLSPQRTDDTYFADIRYLLVVLPLAGILAGLVLASIHEEKPWAAVTLLVVLLNTNLLSLSTAVNQPGFPSKPRLLLPAYLVEISRPYPEAVRAASDYIRENVEKDATVLTYPVDEKAWPLMLYTGDHVFFGSIMDRTKAIRADPGFPWQQIDTLGARVFANDHLPDYFIVFGPTEAASRRIAEMATYHHVVNGVPRESLKFEHVNTLKVYHRTITRPELFFHSFSPITDFDLSRDAVYIFRRVSGSPETPRQRDAGLATADSSPGKPPSPPPP